MLIKRNIPKIIFLPLRETIKTMTRKKTKETKKANASVSMDTKEYLDYVELLSKKGMSFSKRVRNLIRDDMKTLK